ncbi:MAG TPA: hypothetical protein VK196_05435 [Magnetospirillum sp.]|nr:hypothetical protein [Magnetospirillum sp.]
MGGFFSSPSVPTYTPPSPPPALAAKPDDEALKVRQDIMERNRRGRQGMIATSDRGVLSAVRPAGKTLLGE